MARQANEDGINGLTVMRTRCFVSQVGFIL